MSPMAAEAPEVQVEQPPSPTPNAAVAAPTPVVAQAAEQPAAVDPPEKGSKRSRSKSAKGAKSVEGAAPTTDGPSVAAHPRAALGVARAKGWGGLGGFLIAGYLSLPTGTLAEAALRALVAGTVCYVVAWAGAVFVWRRLVMIEIKGREQRLRAAAQSAREQRESYAAPGAPSGAKAAS
ncbi:MAG: hypothetical protein WBQ21_00115 [Solirubrobacteraceae bacterium]